MLSRPSCSIVRPCARRSRPSAAEAISISDEHTGVGILQRRAERLEQTQPLRHVLRDVARADAQRTLGALRHGGVGKKTAFASLCSSRLLRNLHASTYGTPGLPEPLEHAHLLTVERLGAFQTDGVNASWYMQ